MKLQLNTFFITCFICSVLLVSGCSWNNPYAAGTAFGGAASGFRLTAASSSGFVSVDLTFSQDLDPVDAEDAGNYSIPGLIIDAAVLSAAGNTVRLITDEQADQSYTVTVSNVQNAANTLIISPPDDTATFNGIGYSGTVYTPDITVTTTIQAAINAASPGDVVYIPPGTYTENITIAKQITLTGAGSGDNPAVDTILDGIGDANGAHNILIQSGGTSSSNRLIIANLRTIRDPGLTGNDGCPIVIENGDYITFENIVSTNNAGNGICLDPGGATTDIRLSYCNLSNNGNAGFRVPTTVGDMDGLIISNCTFSSNTGPGVITYDLLSTSSVTITDCVFSGNAAGQHTNADLILTSFNGDLTVSDVTIVSSGCESGIRVSGERSGLPSPRPGIAAGTMSFSNIYIRGTQQLIISYPSAGFTLTRYADVSNVSFANINLKSTAPNGLYLGTITSTPPDIGSFSFDGTYTNDIALGRHGNSGSYLYTDVAVDATASTFVGASTNGDIEDRVWHNPDDGNLGTVSWSPP
jgi:hypothetical protein